LRWTARVELHAITAVKRFFLSIVAPFIARDLVGEPPEEFTGAVHYREVIIRLRSSHG